MKLTELDPRWITDTRLVFKCPCCRGIWLSIHTKPTGMGEQCDEIEGALGLDVPYIPCGPDATWSVSGKDFETMSITPSVDASKAGHWHGFISNGLAT